MPVPGRRLPAILLADLVENGSARYKDATRLWLYREYPERVDNLLCIAVSLEKNLVIKTVVRESSRDWHTHISYSAEGDMVEMVVLEARKHVSDPKHLEFVIAASA